MDKLRQFLTDFTSVIQAGKIYPADHPRFREFLEKSYQSLRDILQDQEELAVGIVEGELTSGKEVFFDLSQKLKPLPSYLEERGIQRFSVDRAVAAEEWQKFVTFLSLPRGQVTGDPHEYLALHGVDNIRAGKIEAPSLAARDRIRPEKQYEAGLASLLLAVQKIQAREELDPVESRYLVFSLMEAFPGSHLELLGFAATWEKDRWLFSHLLNTAILTAVFASRLGFSREEVLDIGVAGLYHDIGRVGQAGSGRPSRDNHSLLGACALLRQREGLGRLPAVVAFEHHLPCDLKSRRPLASLTTLHPATRLVSICDIYDELYQKWRLRKHFTPPRIHEIMVRRRGSRFDPEYLDSFYRIMGVWPVGLRVTLTDGRLAVVRKLNEQDIFNPQVEVVDPPDRKEWIDLAERKEKVGIRSALSPFQKSDNPAGSETLPR